MRIDSMTKKNEDINNELEEKNKSHFFDTKASFVSGVVFILSAFNDVTPFNVDVVIVLFSLALFFFVLGTSIFDKKLKSIGVEKFGSYLTVFSIAVFIFSKVISINKSMNVFLDVAFIILVVGGVIGAFYLLFYNYNNDN